MTAAIVSRSGLRSLSWDELAAMLRDGDEAAIPAVLAEARRRERLEQAQRARDAERSTWAEAAHAQYLAADAVCRGVLLSRQGKRAGVSEWSLWAGPEARAMKYASEELREFWYANPRVTVGRYRQQASTGRAAQREDQDASAGACRACSRGVARDDSHGRILATRRLLGHTGRAGSTVFRP